MSELTRRLTNVLSSPEVPRLHDVNRWYTAGDLTNDAAHVQGLLRSAGVKPGDRVVVGLPNSYAFSVVYLALLKYGAVVAPINPGMPGPELAAFLERSRAVCAFFLPVHWTGLRAMMDDDENSLAHLHLNTAFVSDPLVSSFPISTYRKLEGVFVEQEISSQVAVLETPEPSDEDLAILLYTSGTTGRPKAVGLKHRQVLATAENVIAAHHLTDEDVTLCFLPLFHINAQVVALVSTWLSGGRTVLAPKFSASKFWPTVTEHRVTWVSAVPTVIAILLNSPAPEVIPSHLRFVRSASAQLPALHAMRFERQFGVPIIQSYGMTEAASQICVNPLPPGERRLGSVGIPAGLSLKVADENGNDVPAGQIGEICIRGRSVIEEYIEADSQKDFREGWFHTGDLGYIDVDGYVFLTGRQKEMINRAGEKISPYEVEDVIREHPAVKQVAVIGLPDPLYGERVAAYVVANEASWDEKTVVQEILNHCRASISHFKCPSAIDIVAEIPVGPTGKIQRHRLREQVLARTVV